MSTPLNKLNQNSTVAQNSDASPPLRWSVTPADRLKSLESDDMDGNILPMVKPVPDSDVPLVQPVNKPALRTDLPGVFVQSTGLYTPPNCVTNDDLAKYGYDSEWVLQRTGIESRYIAGPDEATSDMAIKAARDCLRLAEVHPSEVDFILVATMTSDHSTPTSANLVQAGLGCSCPAIDVNSACSGFLYALIMGSQFLVTGCSKKVLVIGAEKTSLLADPLSKKTFPLFGDGAGAVLLGVSDGEKVSPSNELDGPSPQAPIESHSEPASMKGILSYRLASIGELGNRLVVPVGGSREPVTVDGLAARRNFLQMEGRSVFKWAVRLVPEIIDELLGLANLEIGDIDLLVMHQANRRIIDAALVDVDIPKEKVFVNVNRYGNTSAASIPIALHEAVVQGQINPGSKVMLIGFGGGLSWAGCIMQW